MENVWASRRREKDYGCWGTEVCKKEGDVLGAL